MLFRKLTIRVNGNEWVFVLPQGFFLFFFQVKCLAFCIGLVYISVGYGRFKLILGEIFWLKLFLREKCRFSYSKMCKNISTAKRGQTDGSPSPGSCLQKSPVSEFQRKCREQDNFWEIHPCLPLLVSGSQRFRVVASMGITFLNIMSKGWTYLLWTYLVLFFNPLVILALRTYQWIP